MTRAGTQPDSPTDSRFRTENWSGDCALVFHFRGQRLAGIGFRPANRVMNGFNT